MASVGRWLPVLFLAAAAVAQGRGGAVRTDTERYRRTRMAWGGSLPTPEQLATPPAAGDPRPKPLLVYVVSGLQSRDQSRFEEVVVENESFVFAAQFFECVQVSEATARAHQLFEGLKWSAPAVIVIDSSRKTREVAHARASAMKAVDLMRMVGQPDYVSDINETLRKAKVLLGTFDQVDAARDALAIKRARVENALGKGDKARAAVLEKDCDRDEEQMNKLFRETEKEWNELFDLKFKKVS
ncbi:MAG: hypothetical protein ACHQ1G_04930 [Planctomycetota bacterium]